MKINLWRMIGMSVLAMTLGGCGSRTESGPSKGAGSGASSSSGESKSQENTTPSKEVPVVAMTELQFAKESQADPKAFLEKYRDKRIEVSGTVAFASNDTADGAPMIILKGENKEGVPLGGSITCRVVRKDADKVDRLTKNQAVKLRGILTWSASHLFECELGDIGFSSVIKLSIDDLVKEFQANKALTIEKYRDKPVLIEGTVIDIVHEQGGTPNDLWIEFILAQSSSQKPAVPVGISCGASNSKELRQRLEAIKKGDKITVLAEFSTPSDSKISMAGRVLK